MARPDGILTISAELSEEASGKGRSEWATVLYAGALLLLALSIYIVFKLASSPDSDWVVGVLTATPAAAVCSTMVGLGRYVRRRGQAVAQARVDAPQWASALRCDG